MRNRVADQSIPLSGAPARALPIWGRRLEFEHFMVELVPSGFREFNVQLDRTFASINFEAAEGTSSLAGDRIRTYERRPFEYIIVPPRFPLQGTTSKAPEVLAFVMDFPSLQQEIEAAMGEEPGTVQPDVFLGSPATFVTSIAKRIRKQLLSPEPPRGYLEALCISLIVEMFKPMTQRRSRRSQNRVGEAEMRMILGYIDANMDRDLSASALSNLLGVTRDQLARAFSEQTGQTAHSYVIARRIDLARKLIAQTNQSLVDVALEAGFSSQSHMTTTFKQQVGITPGALRKLSMVTEDS